MGKFNRKKRKFMTTTLFEKIVYGKLIFKESPAKRFFFHFLVIPFAMNFSIIPFAAISQILVYVLYGIFSILWCIWVGVAFFGWLNKWSAETTQEQKNTSWKLSTGSCPRCFQKVPRLATKCPHCTADI